MRNTLRSKWSRGRITVYKLTVEELYEFTQLDLHYINDEILCRTEWNPDLTRLANPNTPKLPRYNI